MDPYRDPQQPAQAPPPPRRADLGRSRKTFAPRAPSTFAPSLIAAVMVVGLAPVVWPEGWWAEGAVLVSAAAVFAALTWRGPRKSQVQVVLHTEGISVHRGATEDRIPFDEVDELWWKIERRRVPFLGKLAFVVGVRFVDHDGVSHSVPIQLEDAEELLGTIERRCSKPLESPALDALRRGEPLHFGPYTLDETGLRTQRWSLTWEELREVRLLPGQVKLFRGRWLAWKTISLDAMPHPTVFRNLMQAFANRVAKANGLPPPSGT